MTSGSLHKNLVGILGSGVIGYDPFDRKTWSGISYYVFSQIKEHAALHRAFGVEAPKLYKYFLMLRHWNPNGLVWRQQYYMSLAYRQCLTAVIKQRLRTDDFEHDFLTFGAMYDVPSIVDSRALCFSYHDGNLAQSLKSPYCPRGLSAKRIAEGLNFERQVYHGTHRIFAMSEYLRRSFIEDYGVPADRVSTIGAGINLDRIPDVQPDKRYDTKEILFVGSDFSRKGGNELLLAFRRVRDKHKDAQLHVVGPKHVNASPEDSRGVHFHGFLDKNNAGDRHTLDSLFSKCSLFVLPSLYEPFGIAPLEAMAHQIPAVVSKGWALEEMVTPGETGMHVEPGSVDDLADQLSTLLSDPNALQRMGTAARSHVIERYTWPRVIWRMIDEIRSAQRGAN